MNSKGTILSVHAYLRYLFHLATAFNFISLEAVPQYLSQTMDQSHQGHGCHYINVAIR